VPTSPNVASRVITALLTATTLACVSFGASAVVDEADPLFAQASPDTSASPIPIPKETAEEGAERMKHQPMIVNSRLSVTAPEGDVPLGSPVDIDVKFAPGEIADLHLAQFKPHGNVRGGIEQSEDVFKIVREDGQTKTLEFVPMQLGAINLNIGAVYTDNGMAEQTVKLNVVASSKGLMKFSLDGGANVAPMVLADDEKNRQLWLKPLLTYKDVRFPIHLDDSTQIKFGVEQDQYYPAVQVDPNGMVHALHEGKAVITGDFDGATAQLTITVYNKDDYPYY
jgi:hypothetical protein